MEGGTPRWMSPELLHLDNPNPEDTRQTKHSDCYAFGMVIYEVLTGEVPFFKYPVYAVVVKVLKGDRPERPQGSGGMYFTDDLWRIVERCWKHEPGSRPSIEGVLQCLGEASRVWTPPPWMEVSPPTVDSPTRSSSGSTNEETVESEVVSSPQALPPRLCRRDLAGIRMVSQANIADSELSFRGR